MKYKIVFEEFAQAEMIDAAQWYKEQKADLGFEFLDAIEKDCELISFFPAGFPGKFRNTRELVMKRFPCVIVYTVEKDVIYILSVFHSKRNPKSKYKK